MVIKFLIIDLLFIWGFHAHKIINKHAVYTLPVEMSTFYKSNIQYLEKTSVNPDIRKYSDPNEAMRHYIDLEYYVEADLYDSLLSLPFDSVLSRNSIDSLKEWGTLPWSLQTCYFKLVSAFRDVDPALILRYSSDLGHYIADAHVPLHTTKNYNGQLSGQQGIHALWESQIPERYSESYFLFTRRAKYEENVKSRIKHIILSSHEQAHTVLAVDFDLRTVFSKSEIYQLDQKGNYLLKRFSNEYVIEFNKVEGENIEKQMRLAIEAIGDLWLTAWIDAGQPDLNKLVLDQKKLENKAQKETKIIELKEEREHN